MATTKKLRSRVLLADDHRLILDSVRSSLEESGEFEVVGEAMNGSQVLALVKRTHPDVVVLDIRMPGMDGLVCLDQIKKRNPEIKVIVLSASTDQKLIENVLKRGASAYIVKSVNPIDLPSAIRQAIDETVYTAIGLPDDSSASAAKAAGLTARELAILTALAQGKSNAAIAKELWVAPQTVKFHLTNIYRKLERREPHRGRALRLPAGPRREPAVRERRRSRSPDAQRLAGQASLAATSMIWNIAGPRMITNIAGKIRKTSGKRILIGAFCARSSIIVLLAGPHLDRLVAEDLPIETPSRSPCTIARTNERTRACRSASASSRAPRASRGRALCSWIVSRISSPSGPVSRSAAIRSAPVKATPASSVTTSRSISAGSAVVDLREAVRGRRWTKKFGPTQPTSECGDRAEHDRRPATPRRGSEARRRGSAG